MSKVLQIAVREFVATVYTRAFLIGLLFFPAMIGLSAVAMSFMSSRDFLASGQIAVIDPSGLVAAEMRAMLTDGTEAARRADAARQAAIANIGGNDFAAALALAPDFSLLVLPRDADVEVEKSWLLEPDGEAQHLALAVIDSDAIDPDPDSGGYGAYQLFVGPDIDNREEIAVHSLLRTAILEVRLSEQGYDRDLIDDLTQVSRVQSVTVTENAERATIGGFNIILPMVFMFLLFMGIMGGGQGLLTSTIEEKSSRVMEVLLSAVSPMQLMAGKLIGYMSVSLVGMSFYVIAGLLALTSFSLFGLLDPSLIAYLFIFFVIAYFVIGSIMMAIGSAVSEMREAQSLMMPVTIVIILPWLLWLPISRDPNSTLSVAVSFIPPINSFGMLLRMASNEPPPLWQVWTSIGVGILSVYVALWCAARVFRIGLLLTGKPPNFRTLLRWVRMG